MRGDFMRAFMQWFHVKDLGLLTQALGASIEQDLSKGTVTLSLEKYIADLARRYNLIDNVQWADIPIPVAMEHECVKAVVSDAEAAECSEVYGILAGSVVFVATFGRPDVAFSAHFLSRFRCRPGHVHLKLARRVLGYLSRTRALALTYHRGTEDFTSFNFRSMEGKTPDKTGAPHFPVDTDHGVNRSVTGWLFMLGGAAVSCGRCVGSWHQRCRRRRRSCTASAPASATCSSASTFSRRWGSFSITRSASSRTARVRASSPPTTRRWRARVTSIGAGSSCATAYYEREGRLAVVLVKGANNPFNFLTKAVGGKPFAEDRAYAMGLPASTL